MPRVLDPDDLVGVLAAMVTPFTDTLALDRAGLGANATWLRAAGVRVLVVNSSLGEAHALSAAEQRAAVETTAAAVPDAVLIAGCSHPSPDQVIALAATAAAAGAHAVMLHAPVGLRLTRDETLDFFTAVDAGLTVPFLLYDTPLAGELDLSVIERVSALRHFAGLKEAQVDLARFQELMLRYGRSFPVIAAAEDVLLFTLVAGSPAAMTATAAFGPRLVTELCGAVATGDLGTARALFNRLFAFRRLIRSNPASGRPTYIPYTKAAVEIMGGRAGRPRPPLRALTAAERDQLERVLRDEVGLAIPVGGHAELAR